MPHQNWLGNVTFSADQIHTPHTVEALQELVRSSHHVKAVGSKHSFNRIADSDDTLISLEKMNRVVELDTDAMTVTVEGGMIYSDLGDYLHAHGYALHNLASIPHITVVGAVATGTHGSGDGNGNLATAVAALEFVNADGDLVALSRDDDGFYGAVVSLGGLGVISKISLDIEPTYDVQQFGYDNLPVPSLYDHFDDILSSAYSVTIWSKWDSDVTPGLFLKHRLKDNALHEPGVTFFGATLEPAFPGGAFTQREGVPGPWHKRLPHFRADVDLSKGMRPEAQAEYFVAREHAVEAIQRIQTISDQITPLMGITEIRSMTGDQHWLSPSYQRDSVGIHFSLTNDTDTIIQLLPRIEEQIMPLNARPHWGKLFTMSPEYVRSQYDRLDDFRNLLNQHDPNGKFRNDFLNRMIFE